MTKTITKGSLLWLAQNDNRPFYITERDVFRSLKEVQREEAYAFIPAWAVDKMSQESIDRYIKSELTLW